MADLKTVLSLIGILAQIRTMHFQPQAFFALAKRQQFRFGKVSHGRNSPE
jgi:hypothetical protein